MEQQSWPKVELFPKLAATGKFLLRLVSHCPLEAPDYMSTHYRDAPLDTPLEPVTSLPGNIDKPVAETA